MPATVQEVYTKDFVCFKDEDIAFNGVPCATLETLSLAFCKAYQQKARTAIPNMKAAMFKLKSLRIFVEIDISHIHDIDRGILKYMEQFLLKHSTKIGGILISYSVSQISSRGTIIHDNPNVFITADMDLLVLEIPVGCRCVAKDGLVFGAFYSKVEGDGCFNGELVVQGFSVCKGGSTRINGLKPPENTDVQALRPITLQFPVE